jgi:ATP-dependent RNA helicase MSS116, mitochondrial
MLEDGFRDDIDAIVKFLPNTPERQTFIFGEELTYAVKQMASRILAPDHHVINPTPNSQRAAHAHVPQYHTILPNASYQIPYLMKLIAHDQMSHPGKSKVLIYLPTTRMVQLFTTLVRELRTSCLPAGNLTSVYEVHSMISLLERSKSLDRFIQDDSGSSVLLTTDLTAREIRFPGTTRVIQFGIPSSDPIYFNRLAHVSRASGKNGRCDLVLLPWEMGYLTWQLMDVPFTPLTVKEFDIQLLELSETLSNAQGTGSSAPAWVKSPLNSIVMGIESEVKSLLPRLDEESIRETFVSILGYYIPKSGEVRLQRSVIVQGAKDWTIEACGLQHPPYISDAFLIRLGINDGRTKRFGHAFGPNLRRGQPRPESHWLGRGKTIKKETPRSGPLVLDTVNHQLDPRDPSTPPEAYKTNLYGKPDPTTQQRIPRQPRVNLRRDLAAEGWNSIP